MSTADTYFAAPLGWMKGLVFRYIANIDEWESDGTVDASVSDEDRAGIEMDDISRGNVMISKDINGRNYLMLDLDDEEIYLNESSTPGHYHLVFPNPINNNDFMDLVEILHRVGIIKPGNYSSYERLGWLALRTPWVPKDHTSRLTASGAIGPKYSFESREEAISALRVACATLGIDPGDLIGNN